MKQTLKEQLERYLTLSSYNTKLTLSENLKNVENSLNEAGPSPAATLRDVEAAFKSVESLRNEMKITKEIDEIAKLLKMDAKSFEKQLAKAFEEDIKNGFPKGTLGPAAKDVSKVDALRKIAADSKIKGGPLTADEVKVIKDDITATNKLKAAKFEPKAPRTQKDIDDGGKGIKQLPPEGKNWNWKKMLKWGAGIGLSIAAVSWIWTKLHGEEPPPPPPDVTPVPQPSQYKSCPDTFPIAMYCKNETIRKVQGCLGVASDSAFGPKTQAALEAKGLTGTEITQDTVDKVCGGGTTPSPFQDDNEEDTTSNQSTQSADDADEA